MRLGIRFSTRAAFCQWCRDRIPSGTVIKRDICNKRICSTCYRKSTGK